MGTKAGVHIGGKEVDLDTRGFEPDVDLLNNLEAYMAKTMPGARMLPSPRQARQSDGYISHN